MKKIIIMCLTIAAFLTAGDIFSQGLVADMEVEGLSTLYGNECVLTLESGEEIRGTFRGGTYINNGLTKINIKLENGEKAKFLPEQVVSLYIKASGLAKLFMISEATSSIKEFVNTDFNEIVQREYIIFETATIGKKTDKYRLLQLLNPGFDTQIKVFAEPGKETGGLSLGGIQVTGGESRAYLFVKRGEKAVEVKKGSYSKNFEELYSDCPVMLQMFQGEKIKWDDIALHVFVYDQACK